MRRRYETKKMGAGRAALIHQANAIVDEYALQGLTLTLRQLYYQFVARGLISNENRSYKRLGAAITDARMSGLMSWTAIEDRTRFLRGANHWESPADILRAAAGQFRFDRWEDQDVRVEVWIEKDALVGVIEDVCLDEDVGYFSCRGYVSASEMWSAGRRFGRYLAAGQRVHILHLGDHDPSGIDMTHDIQGRLSLFCAVDFWHDEHERTGGMVTSHPPVPTVERIALTMRQVEEFNPPPNPAKLSDSRARDYVQEHGPSSWELDALDPTTLRGLIRDRIEELRDPARWEESGHRQERAREELDAAAEEFAERWGSS